MEQTLIKSDYITDTSLLIDYFYKSYKDKSDFKVGIELEKIGVNSKNFKAVSYSGEKGIANFLNIFKTHDNYSEIKKK